MALGKQVTVTTSPTLLTGGNTGRFTIAVPTAGTASVFLGGANVATGTGYELEKGKQVTLESPNGDPVYGIVATATQRCDVLEVD